ncbi:CidA/LrgA family protein [Paraburkholderia sp. BR14261]
MAACGNASGSVKPLCAKVNSTVRLSDDFVAPYVGACNPEIHEQCHFRYLERKSPLMPFALTILVGTQLIAEVLRRVLHLPLPGPVIGMFLLALALIGPARRWLAPTAGKPSALEQTATTLISNMGLLFVPAGVGIVAELGVLRREWFPIVAGLIVSTVLGLVVTGVVMHRIMRRSEMRELSTAGSQEEAN